MRHRDTPIYQKVSLHSEFLRGYAQMRPIYSNSPLNLPSFRVGARVLRRVYQKKESFEFRGNAQKFVARVLQDHLNNNR